VIQVGGMAKANGVYEPTTGAADGTVLTGSAFNEGWEYSSIVAR